MIGVGAFGWKVPQTDHAANPGTIFYSPLEAIATPQLWLSLPASSQWRYGLRLDGSVGYPLNEVFGPAVQKPHLGLSLALWAGWSR
jgi:hypothetical protein